MQQSLPRLFSETGALIEVDTSSFDQVTLSRYKHLVECYRANEQVEAALGEAVDGVTAALQRVADAENFFNRYWPPQSYHDLWRENFGGGPRNRMTGQGRI